VLRTPVRVQRFLLVLALLGSMVAACTLSKPATEGAPLPDEGSPTFAPTHTPSPAPPPLAILWAPPGADPELVAEAQRILSEVAVQQAWQVSQREGLTEADLQADGEVAVLVALPPLQDLGALISSSPSTRFVTLGPTNLEASPNLTTIGASGAPPDYLGFVAGYMAAVITEDWRVGTISVSDTAEGQAARQGFLIGAKYFCGLCQQLYPPYYDYPLYYEQVSSTSSDAWRAAADQLIGLAVTTIYVAPGAGDQALLEYLAQSNIAIIGSVAPPEALQGNWVATIEADLVTALRDQLAPALRGESALSASLPVKISHVNGDLLSPGKLANVKETLSVLELGLIATSQE
jgi:hypothetical protein